MYVGQWRNDERHGRGVMTYSKSDASAIQEKYDGEFAEGKMSGRGCYWYTDHFAYEVYSVFRISSLNCWY
jgi:hypothetical protein